MFFLLVVLVAVVGGHSYTVFHAAMKEYRNLFECCALECLTNVVSK